MKKSNIFLQYALRYAEQGMQVFPLIPKSKKPLTGDGFKSATTDLDKIMQWWAQWPDANIGIATGKASNLVVLDIDGKYPDHWPDLPELPTVKTHKGAHYYFAYPEGQDVGCRSKIDGYDIDLRGDGGYIVAPPSIHPNGGRYEFVD
jgi:putative DNA primase/helicase